MSASSSSSCAKPIEAAEAVGETKEQDVEKPSELELEPVSEVGRIFLDVFPDGVAVLSDTVTLEQRFLQPHGAWQLVSNDESGCVAVYLDQAVWIIIVISFV